MIESSEGPLDLEESLEVATALGDLQDAVTQALRATDAVRFLEAGEVVHAALTAIADYAMRADAIDEHDFADAAIAAFQSAEAEAAA